MKILVAADGSNFTAKAIDYLTKHAEQFGGADVTLFNAHRPIPGRAANYLGRPTLHKYYSEECDKALNPARRALKKAGISFDDTWKVGEPGDEIAEYATKHKFDMVIMGSHGHGVLGNLVLGSVATRVLARCTVPVLVIR